MPDIPWYERVSIPVLLRRARTTYGTAMREALEDAGYDDIPQNGLYVIGGLALGTGDTPLARIIDDLGLSKQAAGQLVDTLVARGYLERRTDPHDRRRLIVSLTERGRDAARVQTRARDDIDLALGGRTGEAGILALRKVLAALIGLERDAAISPGRAGPRECGASSRSSSSATCAALPGFSWTSSASQRTFSTAIHRSTAQCREAAPAYTCGTSTASTSPSWPRKKNR